MLRGLYHFIFAPALLATGRGPLFYLHPGRSPESQAKERQQRQDDDAFHGGQLLYPLRKIDSREIFGYQKGVGTTFRERRG